MTPAIIFESVFYKKVLTVFVSYSIIRLVDDVGS